MKKTMDKSSKLAWAVLIFFFLVLWFVGSGRVWGLIHWINFVWFRLNG